MKSEQQPTYRAPQRQASASSADTGDRSHRVKFLLLIAVLGLGARLALAASTWGTTDTASFVRFAWNIDRHGIMETYRSDREFNHPPPAAYWAWAAFVLSDRDPNVFAFVFRLPMILADVGCAVLLWKIWRGRGGGGSRARAAGVAAAYAWSLVAILVSGYHGNTDPAYAFFSLLAVYLIHDRARPFWGGVALAAGVNVKLIPLLLIPALALSLRTRADLARFAGGLALGVLPFLPPLVLAGPSFRQNVLAYRSQLNLWGVNFFLLQPDPPADAAEGGLRPAVAAYRAYGGSLLLALIGAWAVAARRWPRWDRYEVAAVTYAVFLVVAPGFGVQYLVVLVPLLFATRPGLATAFATSAGAFVLGAYYIFWDGEVPVSSLFNRMFPTPIGILGLIPWALLIYFVAAVLVSGARRPSQSLAGPIHEKGTTAPEGRGAG